MTRASTYEIHVHTPEGVLTSTITTDRIVDAFDRCREVLQAIPDATTADLRLGAAVLHSMRRRKT